MPLWREAYFQLKIFKKTRGSNHFWKLQCRKNVRRCYAKYISKAKYIKHHMFTSLLEVQMSKKYTPLQHFQIKIYKVLRVHATFRSSNIVSLRVTTLRFTTLHYPTLHYLPLHFTTLHSTTTTQLHSTTLHYTPLHSTTLHHTKLHYATLHSAALLIQLQLHNYTPLHSTKLHYTKLHYPTLHYITLH